MNVTLDMLFLHLFCLDFDSLMREESLKHGKQLRLSI
jgi:hypothetical protein